MLSGKAIKRLMKRIGIFVFYDEEGIVDKYKLLLLDSLKEYFTDLIVVVNGFICQNELHKLEARTEHVFLRENKGYDGGAYKDVFIGKYIDLDWKMWDEIIMFNDTFYGPLYSWKEIFQHMEKIENDFWGLSQFYGGTMKKEDSTIMYITEHIQAYFIAIKKKMFSSPFWNMFWNEMKYATSYHQAIEKFEIAFTAFFKEKGFCYSSWLYECTGDTYLKEGICAYSEYGLELLKYGKFPIIKWRVMSPLFYKTSCLIMEYVNNYTNYDKSLIAEHLKRVEDKVRPFSMSTLESFVHSHAKVYIFGHGIYGKKLEKCFEEKNWKLDGFVVSKPQSNDEMGLSELVLGKEDGLIVALGSANVNEVRSDLESKFDKSQILFPK